MIMQIYIIDDDLASRRMLNKIICDSQLGDVVGEAEDPSEAELEVINLQPDLVLIDMLMPNQDGIETIHNLKQRKYIGKFIMISQVEKKQMVEKAYQEGIEYFIHKPINRVEVSSVITKVIEQIKMERSLSKIKEGLALINSTNNVSTSNSKNISYIIQNIYGDLGIYGESGSNDLVDILVYLYESKKGTALMNDNLTLREIYIEVLSKRLKKVEEKDIKTIEQRLRRAINQAMTNLASLGLTDYAHPKFEHYATKFFDFNEIRKRMREIDRDETNKGKINLKKFIYAFYNEIIFKID